MTTQSAYVNESMVVNGTLTTLDDIAAMYSLTGHRIELDADASYQAMMVGNYGFAEVVEANGIKFGVPTMVITEKGHEAIRKLVQD